MRMPRSPGCRTLGHTCCTAMIAAVRGPTSARAASGSISPVPASTSHRTRHDEEPACVHGKGGRRRTTRGPERSPRRRDQPRWPATSERVQSRSRRDTNAVVDLADCFANSASNRSTSSPRMNELLVRTRRNASRSCFFDRCVLALEGAKAHRASTRTLAKRARQTRGAKWVPRTAPKLVLVSGTWVYVSCGGTGTDTALITHSGISERQIWRAPTWYGDKEIAAQISSFARPSVLRARSTAERSNGPRCSLIATFAAQILPTSSRETSARKAHSPRPGAT